jgi:hypothetical protein
MLDKAIEDLAHHPFTAMSLADREKFHTGLLAYAIRSFPETLIPRLFGVQGPFQNIQVPVERESIDLQVLDGSRVIAMAEVKLKSDLHGDQLARYASKHPSALLVTVGLFPPVPVDGTRSLPKHLYLTKEVRCAVSDAVAQHRNVLSPEENGLLSLWCSYLALLDKLLPIGDEPEVPVSQAVRAALEHSKLSGIFERQRLARVMRDAKLLCQKEQPKYSLHNTHGRALLDLKLEIDADHEIFAGLQLQASSLKLFVSRGVSLSQDWRSRRSAWLPQAARRVVESARIAVFADSEKLPKESAPNGAFSSITIATLDTWGNCAPLGRIVAEAFKCLYSGVHGLEQLR